MIEVTGDILDTKYYRLLHYLFSKCDVITFHIPNQYQWYATQKNIEMYPAFDLDNDKNEEDCEEYIQYKKNIEYRVNHFRRFFIKEYIDVEYAGGLYGNKMEIKIIRFDEYLLRRLKATHSLYDWRYPNMPEDLCFYSQGKCFLRSVAHEKLCFIYDNSEKTLTELKKIKLDFYQTFDVPAPILETT